MDIKGRIIAERVFSDSSLFTFFGDSAGNYGCFGIVDSFCYYNRILSPQEIQHNFSVLSNSPSINAIETTDSNSDKTSFLFGTDTDHVTTRTGHTEEERYTALLNRFGKKFTSTGEDITVENAIENQRVLSGKISGNTVKVINQYEKDITLTGGKHNLPLNKNNTNKRTIYTLVFSVKKFTGSPTIDFRTDQGIVTSDAISKLGVNYKVFTTGASDSVLDGYIRLSPSSVTSNCELEIDYVFVVEGDVKNKITSYIPFGLSSTQAIITNNGLKYSFYANEEDKASGKVIDLGGVGDDRNTLEIKEDGSAVYTQNTKEIVLNSNQTITLVDTRTNTVRFSIQFGDSILNKNGILTISNNFVSRTFSDVYSRDIEGIALWDLGTALSVRILKSKLVPADITGFKTWLSSNPTTVRYQLATPIVTHIPKELVPTILTQVANKFTFGDAVKPSSAEITVPVDKVTDLETRLSRLEKVMTSTSNLSLMANYVEDEYNDSLNQV